MWRQDDYVIECTVLAKQSDSFNGASDELRCELVDSQDISGKHLSDFYRRQNLQVQAHNREIGTRMQSFVQVALAVWVLGPVVNLLLKVFFSIRVIGQDRLDSVRQSSFLAIRHFFEWDPLLTLPALLWTRAIRRPHLVPLSLAGRFWMQNQFMRALSWSLGVMGLMRGREPHDGAIKQVVSRIEGDVPTTVAVYPTGPIGKTQNYVVRRGIGHLALSCPDVPVIPVTIIGVQELSLLSVFTLRRPEITIAVGEPFTAADIVADTVNERMCLILSRIAQDWTRNESRLKERPTELQVDPSEEPRRLMGKLAGVLGVSSPCVPFVQSGDSLDERRRRVAR
jgi:1-acyl-sn-glycerol-3-phosphate acyltransferase